MSDNLQATAALDAGVAAAMAQPTVRVVYRGGDGQENERCVVIKRNRLTSLNLSLLMGVSSVSSGRWSTPWRPSNRDPPPSAFAQVHSQPLSL